LATYLALAVVTLVIPSFARDDKDKENIDA